MPFDLTKRWLIAAMLCCGVAGPIFAQQTPGNQAGYIASGQTATLDWTGGKAVVMGSNNVLTIRGNCTGLDMCGSGNKITIDFAPSAQIDFVGSQNTIAWSSTDGKPPKVSYVGSGNTLAPPIH